MAMRRLLVVVFCAGAFISARPVSEDTLPDISRPKLTTVEAMALSGMAMTPKQLASLAQTHDRPTLGAYFAKESLLAFWIECRNSSETNVYRQDSRWLQSYRIDGVQPQPGRGRGGSGPNPEIAPGATWRGILVLHSFSSSFSSRAVADLKISVSADILPGRHTIAVQCFDAWSDDLVFMWDPTD